MDNIVLAPSEKMIFKYDLEYTGIPLRKISITRDTYWSKDLLPDIKALVKNKIEETWTKLKDLCYEEDDPEGQIGDGNPMVVEEGD